MATAACGTRWTDAQEKAFETRGAASERGSNNSDAATATTLAEDQTAAIDEPSTGGTGGTTGGTTGGSTAGGGATGGGTSGPKPCTRPSTAPGVTNDTITIGNVTTLTGPVPGFGETALAASRAYIAYRNSTGGVCGRKIVLKSSDDGFDNGRNRSAYQQLIPQVLGFAGGIGIADGGGAAVVEEAKVPSVGVAVTRTMESVSTLFDINPPFSDVNALIGKDKFLFDQGVRTASLVFVSSEAGRQEILDKQKPQIEAAGIKVVNVQEMPISTLSFDSTARAVANSKADYMLYLGAVGQSAQMARSMFDTGYKLKFAEYLTSYGSNFIELAGPGAEGAVSWIRTLPNEEPNTTPEQAAFLKWFDQTAPNLRADTFAADAWAGSKAFFDALEALPEPISRAGLITKLKSMNPYDAGGLLGPIKLGSKQNNGCLVAMQVSGGKWNRLAPAKGFLC
jgi:ABC-type branched-subunit amino acid transport system substrate-binding protein